MFIPRRVTSDLTELIKKGQKVLIIYGPRQAGKTTLINHITKDFHEDEIKRFVGDDLFTQNIFSRNELTSLKSVIGSAKYLIIDEAQKIDNIGDSLKLLIDNCQPLTILASGSSSFELADKVSEALTGRSQTFWLYPFAHEEIKEKYSNMSADLAMSDWLRFGMLPAVVTQSDEKSKRAYLDNYINNYLYRDILSFKKVKKPKKVVDLLALLALQIGNEVNVAELAQNISLSQQATANYLDLLEKMFIIVNVRGFSRNLRKEISKTSKYYFLDTGLRNALIHNFNPLNIRDDVGDLFENWFIVEKMKQANNHQNPANYYFWRTTDQQEIDLIEERDGKLIAYECKWSPKKNPKAPIAFANAYLNAEYKVINPSNFADSLK